MIEPTEGEAMRRALVSAWNGATASEDCPPDGTIVAAAAGELQGNGFQEVLDHVSGCPACQRSWAVAIGLRSCQAASASRMHARQASWARPLAIAASLIVVSGAAWMAVRLAPDGARQASENRGDTLPTIVATTPPGAALSRDSCLLAWKPLSDDPRYELVATTAELEPVAEVRELSEPSYRIPSDDLRQLPPGTVLLWRIEARLADGRRVRSATFRNVLD